MKCPDGGTCHHDCGEHGGKCWRVGTCEPLTGVFLKNRWPRWAWVKHSDPRLPLFLKPRTRWRTRLNRQQSAFIGRMLETRCAIRDEGWTYVPFSMDTGIIAALIAK